jgi:hypothetical protein
MRVHALCKLQGLVGEKGREVYTACVATKTSGKVRHGWRAFECHPHARGALGRNSTITTATQGSPLTWGRF